MRATRSGELPGPAPAGCIPRPDFRELHQSDYLATVTTALAVTGLPADRLVLELTESQ